MGKEEGSPDNVGIGVKLPESREEALALPYVTPSGYGLGRHGWVNVKVPIDVDPPLEVLSDWIDESYRAVAPKRLTAQLEEQRKEREHRE